MVIIYKEEKMWFVLLGNPMLPTSNHPSATQVLPTMGVKYSPKNLTVRLESQEKHVWNSGKQLTIAK